MHDLNLVTIPLATRIRGRSKALPFVGFIFYTEAGTQLLLLQLCIRRRYFHLEHSTSITRQSKAYLATGGFATDLRGLWIFSGLKVQHQ